LQGNSWRASMVSSPRFQRIPACRDCSRTIHHVLSLVFQLSSPDTGRSTVTHSTPRASSLVLGPVFLPPFVRSAAPDVRPIFPFLLNLVTGEKRLMTQVTLTAFFVRCNPLPSPGYFDCGSRPAGHTVLLGSDSLSHRSKVRPGVVTFPLVLFFPSLEPRRKASCLRSRARFCLRILQCFKLAQARLPRRAGRADFVYQS